VAVIPSEFGRERLARWPSAAAALAAASAAMLPSLAGPTAAVQRFWRLLPLARIRVASASGGACAARIRFRGGGRGPKGQRHFAAPALNLCAHAVDETDEVAQTVDVASFGAMHQLSPIVVETGPLSMTAAFTATPGS
jgi:hypothetical protein